MSRQTFLLPDLGEGLSAAQLVRWLVGVGDSVSVDAPVAEVETAKAIVEVPSPFAGVVAELHGDEGATIAVGTPLISVTTEPAYVEEERAGSGNVLIGYGTSTTHNRRRRIPRATTVVTTSRPPVSSPVVRKLAKDKGVDLTAIRGTGPGGLITRADVEHVPAEAMPATDPRTGLAVAERIPLRGVRAAIATALSRSRAEIPEATTWVDVDATKLVRLRAELSDGPGLLAFVARFVVAGLVSHPVLNSTVDSDEIRVFGGVNLGIATQTDRGLVVPVVRNAHHHTARGLDAEIRRVTTAARDGSVAEMSGGSFTLNNYGSFGVDGSAAIINHPEVAILGMGRILERPWVVNGRIRPRHITQLSLVFDHRVCDGATAAGFLRFVTDAIESPKSVLADL
jgi:2-oxoisovalerate dehydrogenase E2 component (dihydrolipoyl transacylase)